MITPSTSLKGLQHSIAGGALLVCLGVTFLTAIVVAGALTLTQGVARNAARSQVRHTATQMGLGALDMAYASWRDRAREGWSGHPTTADLTNIKKAVSADFSNAPGYTISNISVSAATPQLAELTGSTVPVPAYGPSNSTSSYYYVAKAQVTATGVGAPVTVKVRRIFEKEIISPWDYAIFYDADLELHPGAPQTITGWVHTNGALYTGHDLLTFGSRVTNVRGWTIGFMPGDGAHPSGTPQSPHYQADIPPAKDTNRQPFGIDPWAVFAPRNSDGSNDGWIELIKRPVPGVADPKADARYYNQADIRILVNNSNVVTMTDKTGATIVPDPPNTNPPTKRDQLYRAFQNAVTTDPIGIGSLQDNRESETSRVRIVTLDVEKIATAVNTNQLDFNGIVYIADTSASTSGTIRRRGVKIANAAVAPKKGLSIVSENPVYIQGNVNTDLGIPPSNMAGGDPKAPTVGEYKRKAVLIAGDSINILSNAWTDAKSTLPVGERDATPTTVNAALLGGIVRTGTVGQNYSGGAENFPRFLENWSGVNLTYYGSIVCLYESQQGTGIWGNDEVYSPPNRRWYFDTLLRQRPPPGNLTTTNYLKARWWTD